MRGLTPHQLALQAKRFTIGPEGMIRRAKKAVTWCRVCGAKHSGPCDLVLTVAGTRCRADIVEQVEDRYRNAR